MFLLFIWFLSLAGIIACVIRISRSKFKTPENSEEKETSYPYRRHNPISKALSTHGNKIGLGVAIFFFCITSLSTSLVVVTEGTTGHFTRVWGGQALTSGQIIANKPMNIFTGQKGPQSETVLPGTHFMFMQNVLYKRARNETEEMLYVPKGKFAVLVAKDGLPMTGNRMLAGAWEDENFNNMLLDATFFLNNGGMKGIQYTVIPSGSYHINRYLWDVVQVVDEAKITTGEVAVVRSNIRLDPNQDCNPIDDTTAVPLVPMGCRGVWIQELEQGTYRFNPLAVTVTPISVRQNTNDHKGGYTRKIISFDTDDEGNILPILTDHVESQSNAIDDAIDIRAEGWNINQDVSVFWQIVDAPKAVAELGDQDKIAQFIARVTQSQFRIVAQGSDVSKCEVHDKTTTDDAGNVLTAQGSFVDPSCALGARRALDLVYEREAIESQSLASIQQEVQRYGIRINKVTMGRPNIPPELLMPTLRSQYAESMRRTFREEEQTASQRIAVRNANELANRQDILVDADLRNQAAEKEAQRIVTLADARKKAAFDEALGQQELLNVMGAERVQEQILVRTILDAIKECPECVKMPTVLVNSGDGSSLEGAAAILGASNITNMINSTRTSSK